MMIHKSLLFGITSFLILAGCTALMVPKVSDPDMKMGWAAELLLNQGRPIPAEQLIRESMVIYEEQNDLTGLGTAYQYYGVFLSNVMVTAMEKSYRKWGFWDESVTYDNRLDKASEYFAKSLEYFRRAEREQLDASTYDGLPRIYFNMAVTYFNLDDQVNACDFVNKSLDADREYVRRNPDAKPAESFEVMYKERIKLLANDTGCAKGIAAGGAGPTDYQILKGLVRVSYQQQETDPKVLDHLAGVAWRDRGTEDEQLVDTLSWICKVLGQSQNPRYTTVLKMLASEASDKKLRKYAQANLPMLSEEVVTQFDPESDSTTG